MRAIGRLIVFANVYDNTLIQTFLPIINSGLTADGFTTVTVKQANQPTMQGINTNPTCYFFKTHGKRYGYLGRYDAWNSNTSQMVHKESQYYESTWQFSALVLQSPLTPNQYTAADIVDEVASILQSDVSRETLNNSGIGILRISDIVNPYFTDDRDNFEASPNFEVTFTYQNFRVTQDPKIDDFTVDVISI